MKKTLFTVAFASALFSMGSAQAATETFTYSKIATPTNWSQSVSLGMFDTNLGILNSITFGINGNVTGSGTYKNNNSDSEDLSVSLGSRLTLRKLSTDASSVYLVQAKPLIPEQDFTIAANSSYSTPTMTNTMSKLTTYTDAADLAYFSQTGAGNISLYFTGKGNSSYFGPSNVDTSVVTSAGGMATVTYDYTAVSPVPEPETYAMLLAGLGLMGFMSRRRKSA